MEKKFEKMTEKEVLESGIAIPYSIIGYRIELIHTHFKNKGWFTPEQVAGKLKLPLKQVKDLLRGFVSSLFLAKGDPSTDEWEYKLMFDIKYLAKAVPSVE